MKVFTVIWFYVANYRKKTVQATCADAAIEQVTGFFDEAFRKKARIMVFEGEPLLDLGNLELGNRG